MAHLSIRVRLTLWYSLVLLVGLTLFGTGIWLVVSHGLMAALDDTLTAQARGVITVLHTEPDPAEPQELSEELTEYSLATPEGTLMEVRDPQGRPMLSSKVASLEQAS